MKKVILLILIAVATAFQSNADGIAISQTDLPKAALNFISKYFSNEKIRKIEKEQGRRGVEYEVDFSGGGEIDFREDGSWKKVKVSHGNSIPSDIVPSAIAAYVKKNYPDQAITEIELKRGGYEIELSNGIELKLTEDAKPFTEQRRGRGQGDHRQQH